MDARGIIIDYLKANGYDGLAGEECGCGLDDLSPCCEPFMDCEPAFRWRCAAGCHRIVDEGPGCEFEGEGCWRTEKQAPLPEVTS